MKVPQHNTLTIKVVRADDDAPPRPVRVSLLNNTLHRVVNVGRGDVATFHGVRPADTEVVVMDRGLVVGRREITVPAAGELSVDVRTETARYQVTAVDPGSCTSTVKEAHGWIETNCTGLAQSGHFMRVPPTEFVAQLKKRVAAPYDLNQGVDTNFCWAAASMSYTIERDPRGFAELMLSLYTTGEGVYRCREEVVTLSPSPPSKDAIGTSTFDNDGDLAANLVDQMLFMSMADHYKNYFNATNRRYDQGDEGGNSWWAGGTLGKFRRVMRDFGHKIKVRGSDVIFAHRHKARTVQDELAAGRAVMLFINHAMFKNEHQGLFKKLIGTHWIRVVEFAIKGEDIYVKYWHYGREDKWTLSDRWFQRSVHGIVSVCP